VSNLTALSLLADYHERPSDSPFVDVVMTGRTESHNTTTRPAENQWHLCFVRHPGGLSPIVTGPLLSTGIVNFITGLELIWIRFKLGVFMPGFPLPGLLDTEATLPAAAGRKFWLDGSAWQFPTYDNADTFVDRLMRQQAVIRDPLVAAALADERPAVPDRTLRHRFLRATGLTQGRVRQIERAKHAAALLRQGHPILDVVHDAGYFDQPHLTRALKRWVGHTPAQLLPATRPSPVLQPAA
jgi:AraC-like DNA-binding protein